MNRNFKVLSDDEASIDMDNMLVDHMVSETKDEYLNLELEQFIGDYSSISTNIRDRVYQIKEDAVNGMSITPDDSSICLKTLYKESEEQLHRRRIPYILDVTIPLNGFRNDKFDYDIIENVKIGQLDADNSILMADDWFSLGMDVNSEKIIYTRYGYEDKILKAIQDAIIEIIPGYSKVSKRYIRAYYCVKYRDVIRIKMDIGPILSSSNWKMLDNGGFKLNFATKLFEGVLAFEGDQIYVLEEQFIKNEISKFSQRIRISRTYSTLKIMDVEVNDSIQSVTWGYKKCIRDKKNGECSFKCMHNMAIYLKYLWKYWLGDVRSGRFKNDQYYENMKKRISNFVYAPVKNNAIQLYEYASWLKVTDSEAIGQKKYDKLGKLDEFAFDLLENCHMNIDLIVQQAMTSDERDTVLKMHRRHQIFKNPKNLFERQYQLISSKYMHCKTIIQRLFEKVKTVMSDVDRDFVFDFEDVYKHLQVIADWSVMISLQGDYIQQEPSFTNYLKRVYDSSDPTEKILILSGDAGSGKSTFMNMYNKYHPSLSAQIGCQWDPKAKGRITNNNHRLLFSYDEYKFEAAMGRKTGDCIIDNFHRVSNRTTIYEKTENMKSPLHTQYWFAMAQKVESFDDIVEFHQQHCISQDDYTEDMTAQAKRRINVVRIEDKSSIGKLISLLRDKHKIFDAVTFFVTKSDMEYAEFENDISLQNLDEIITDLPFLSMFMKTYQELQNRSKETDNSLLVKRKPISSERKGELNKLIKLLKFE